jgi:hypothetical protein
MGPRFLSKYPSAPARIHLHGLPTSRLDSVLTSSEEGLTREFFRLQET